MKNDKPNMSYASPENLEDMDKAFELLIETYEGRVGGTNSFRWQSIFKGKDYERCYQRFLETGIIEQVGNTLCKLTPLGLDIRDSKGFKVWTELNYPNWREKFMNDSHAL